MFALSNGVMNINEINGKAYPKKGLDLKGSGSVKLSDYALDLTLDIIDTYTMLGDKAPIDDRLSSFRAVAESRGHAFLNPNSISARRWASWLKTQ
jgi:hypothetical protein